jgi:hypothetical protein
MIMSVAPLQNWKIDPDMHKWREKGTPNKFILKKNEQLKIPQKKIQKKKNSEEHKMVPNWMKLTNFGCI